jgi:hypothetical protein
MGYTILIHGYRIYDKIRPLCTDCNQDITVEHILWQCLNYDIQRSKSNISREALGNNNTSKKSDSVSKYRRQRATHHGEPMKMEDMQG